MNDLKADRDVNRVIRSWLREDRHEDVSRVAGAVLDRVETIPQRRSTWWPARRTLTVNRIPGIGLAAGAVVAVLIIGAQLAGSLGSGAVGTATTLPTATPVPTATPTSSPASAPGLTQTYTSAVHGISVSFPEGWVARPATEPYMDRPGVPQVLDPGMDVLSDPAMDDHLFFWIFSTPLGDSTPDEWAATATSGERCATTEPIVVDGATGLFSNECAVVAVTAAGRGYVIGLYTPTTGEGHALSAPYDRTWFEAVLATVKLPASAPPLTQTYTSTVHGISVSYPEGWVARPATEPYINRPGVPQVLDPGVDVLSDPAMDDHLFLWIYSTPIGDSTPDEWVAAAAGGENCATTEPFVVDGASGLFSNVCALVVVTTAGRGYSIALYTPTTGEGHALSAPYARTWFEAVLATVKLHPEDAVD